MSGLDDYNNRMAEHARGTAVAPAQNAAEVTADRDAAAARGQGGAIPAANLGWFLGLWDRGPIGRGVFLMVLSLPLSALGGSLPGILSLVGTLAGTLLFLFALGMFGYGLVRALLRR